MSSGISLPTMDLSNPEYLLPAFEHRFEERCAPFPIDISLCGNHGLERSEVPLDKFMSRYRNLTSNFEVYQPYVTYSPSISTVQSLKNIKDNILQMQPPSAAMRDVDEREANMLMKKTRRMIKNRESAARSRARRQAYTAQLEIEVKLLTEENRMLRENLQKIQSDIAMMQSKKGSRPCSSAEF